MKTDHALFDMGQERILLHLVEAVYLVDEQHGANALRKAQLRLGERGAHFGQAGQHRRDRAELGIGVFREQQCERGLATTGRPPEDHRMHVPGLDRSPQRTARTEQALLADDLAERARPHAFRERFQGVGSALEQRADGWGLAWHRRIISERLAPMRAAGPNGFEIGPGGQRQPRFRGSIRPLPGHSCVCVAPPDRIMRIILGPPVRRKTVTSTIATNAKTASSTAV